ncbi:MAG: biotin--[acetyl-CoA-carboxylase] ligase [Planctomycetes bacterium]|nr:biotin--[acetyl-CoA-carboxylase] ligase [Planctomycetota bacterium]
MSIERDLGTSRVGRNVICFEVLDSTNDTAADSARQADSDGLVVLAERQRRGRGRGARAWLSEPGANVLMSVVLRDDASHLPAEPVTIAAGMAVAEAVEAVLADPGACRLKWPNDVLLEGRKVAGILVEQRRGGSARSLIVGIGINVNAHPGDDRVDRPATSLARRRGGPVDRVAVVRAVCRALDGWVADLTADRRRAVERLGALWGRRCGMVNCRHTILSGGRATTGTVVAIDPLEGLLLRTDEGFYVHIRAEGATVA